MRIFVTLMNLISSSRDDHDDGFIVDSSSPTNKLLKGTNKNDVHSFKGLNLLYFKQITAFWHVSDRLTRCSKTTISKDDLQSILRIIQQNIYRFAIGVISTYMPHSTTPSRVRVYNVRAKQLNHHQHYWYRNCLGKRGKLRIK